jgi:hypothetical protein
VLRGLRINGQAVHRDLVRGSNATSNHREQHDRNGFTFSPSAPSEFFVKDSVFRNNGINGGSAFGLAKGTIDRSRFEDNASEGFLVFNSATVAIRDSVAAGNGGTGIAAVGTAGQNPRISVTSSVISNNAFQGIWASGQGGTAEIAVDGSNVFGNGQDGIGAHGAGSIATASRNLVTRNRSGLLRAWGRSTPRATTR